MTTVLKDRLTDWEGVVLQSGSHKSPDDGMCAMEAAAWLAGEPHGDAPVCVDPIVRRIMVVLNDKFRRDGQRQALKPLVERSIGTGGDGRHDERRLIVMRHIVHTVLPMWLDRAGDHERAATMRAIPIDSSAGMVAASASISAASEAMWLLRVAQRDGFQAAMFDAMQYRGPGAAAIAGAGADAADDAATDAVGVCVAVRVAADVVDGDAPGVPTDAVRVAVRVAADVAADVADAATVAAGVADRHHNDDDGGRLAVRTAVYLALSDRYAPLIAEWQAESDMRTLSLLDRLVAA